MGIKQSFRKRKGRTRSSRSPHRQPCGLSFGGTGTMEMQTMHSVGPPENPDPNWELWGSYVPCITAPVLAGSYWPCCHWFPVKSSVFMKYARNDISCWGNTQIFSLFREVWYLKKARGVTLLQPLILCLFFHAFWASQDKTRVIISLPKAEEGFGPRTAVCHRRLSSSISPSNSKCHSGLGTLQSFRGACSLRQNLL